MSIHKISTVGKANEIMGAAYLHYAGHHPIIFDLIESLDSNEVPVSINQCEECKRIAWHRLGDDNEGNCPKCSQPMKKLVVVQLVVQGGVVIWRES